MEPEIKDNRSSDEIDRLIVSLEKDLQSANLDLAETAKDYNIIRRSILEKKQELSALEIKRHESGGFMGKARENVKRVESEIRINKSLFWMAKKEGR
jgi:hypothetical protein